MVRVLEGDANDRDGWGQLSSSLWGITVCADTQTGDPELLVADSGNHRVVAFRLDGSAARVVCGSERGGLDTRHMIEPAGVAVTATGNLWVVEPYNNRVSLYR